MARLTPMGLGFHEFSRPHTVKMGAWVAALADHDLSALQVVSVVKDRPT